MNQTEQTRDRFDRLVDIMARLRTPDTGCPWDIEQSFDSIAPCTIEEAYEVADAINRKDMDDLCDELGDLLLQVVFHSRMAEEDGLFSIDDVIDAISDKMIRRHPHVFGDQSIDSAESQTALWEHIKAEERSKKAPTGNDSHPASILDDVPVALPALTRALKLQKRAARVGFDWADARLVVERLREEIDELETELAHNRQSPERIDDEVGDLLFTCVNIARQLSIDPETALRQGNIKFETRFRELENILSKQNRQPQDLSLGDLEKAWREAKQSLSDAP